jgi:hypothetical protein
MTEKSVQDVMNDLRGSRYAVKELQLKAFKP